MQSPKDQLNQLLTPLCFLMQLSREAYTKYLANKTYLHAESIRQANQKICTLLTTKAGFIPADLEDDIVILLNHYHGWFTQFRDHKKKIKPGLNDEFVFYPVEGQVPFPKKVEERIFRYTEDLKKEINKQAQTTENDI
jgi:hypothetical protein